MSKTTIIMTCALSLIAPLPSQAAEPSCEAPCPMELFVAFFPPPFVRTTLAKFGVPQGKRLDIQQQLTHHELDINSIVEAKAAKMNPNPLNQPDQQEIVVKLFDDAVLQVFTQVMNDNGITDDNQIAEMLADIHRQKAERFKQCRMLDIKDPN